MSLKGLIGLNDLGANLPPASVEDVADELAKELVASADHTVTICGGMTGHTMRNVALCEDATIGAAIRHMIVFYRNRPLP